MSSRFKQDIVSPSHCTWVEGKRRRRRRRHFAALLSQTVVDLALRCLLFPFLSAAKWGWQGRAPGPNISLLNFSPRRSIITPQWSPNYPINCPLGSLPLFLSRSPVQTASKLVHVFRFLSRLSTLLCFPQRKHLLSQLQKVWCCNSSVWSFSQSAFFFFSVAT